ncbi:MULTISPECIES: hypothetical protein [Duganella]|jgi:hypothetical protein|nr:MULTISPECIES: hypothetical protein [Duganella]
MNIILPRCLSRRTIPFRMLAVTLSPLLDAGTVFFALQSLCR